MSSLIDLPRRLLYRSPIRTVIEKFGFRPYLSSAYWKVVLTLSGNSVDRTVAGVNTTFYVSSPYEFTRFNDDTFKGEIDVMEHLLNEIKEDDVFYDIGANVGLHACFVANAIPEGDIIAFEPHPRSVAQLRENIDLNGEDCSVFECALSDSEGNAVLELPTDLPGAVGNLTDSPDKGTEQVEIDLVCGDNLISAGQVPAPTVLKIDVDGGEVNVLRGLSDALSRESCRRVYCEVHPEALEQYGATEDELYTFFENHGFTIEKFDVDHEMREDAYYVLASKE